MNITELADKFLDYCCTFEPAKDPIVLIQRDGDIYGIGYDGDYLEGKYLGDSDFAFGDTGDNLDWFLQGAEVIYQFETKTLDVWQLHTFTPKFYLGYLGDDGLVIQVSRYFDTFEEARKALPRRSPSGDIED